MKLNVFNYYQEGLPITVYKTGINSSELHRIPPGICIDAAMFLPVFTSLNRYSQRIYAHLVGLMESNDKPVIIRASVLRNATTVFKRHDAFAPYVTELVRAGLIIKPGRNMYYINPVYAWKPGSEVCFDPKYVPVLPAEEAKTE